MKKLCSKCIVPLLFLGVFPLYADSSFHRNYSSLTLSGDILANALPVLGIAASYQLANQELATQSLLSAGVLLVSADVLKRTFNLTPLGVRPNGYSRSFPSGHTAGAFLGARMLYRAYGPVVGAPAYGLAALTAYSRIEGKYHRPRDIVAGIALAFLVDSFTFNHLESLRAYRKINMPAQTVHHHYEEFQYKM